MHPCHTTALLANAPTLDAQPASASTAAEVPALMAAPAAPNAGERCFATTLAASGQFSSTDGKAVYDATSAAPAGGTVKVAGYCAGIDPGLRTPPH